MICKSQLENAVILIRALKLIRLVLVVFISFAKDTHATRTTRLFNHFQIVSVLKPFEREVCASLHSFFKHFSKS